jgi:hypothetical protein
MTVLINNIYAEDCIVSHCDTISTHIGTTEENLDYGTSTGEIFYPSQKEYYKEDSCKFGLVSENCYFSITGNYNLASTILSPAIELIQENPTIENIKKILSMSCSSVFNGTENCSTEIHWSLVQKGELSLFNTIFSFNEKGIRKQYNKANISKGQYYIAGSGITLFREYGDRFVHEAIKHSPSLENYLINIFSHDYISFIRFKRGLYAQGVGGGFLGIGMNRSGIKLGRSAIHILAIDNKVKFMTKHNYSANYAIIADYMKAKITIFPYVNHNIFIKNNPTYYQTTERQQALNDDVLKLSSFDAEIIFIDSRKSSEPNSPNVGIVENDGKSVILGLEFNVTFANNIPHFTPGSKLTIKSESSSYDFDFE